MRAVASPITKRSLPSFSSREARGGDDRTHPTARSQVVVTRRGRRVHDCLRARPLITGASTTSTAPEGAKRLVRPMCSRDSSSPSIPPQVEIPQPHGIRALPSGETRTRTGDTRIFSRAVATLEWSRNRCKQTQPRPWVQLRSGRKSRSFVADPRDAPRPSPGLLSWSARGFSVGLSLVAAVGPNAIPGGEASPAGPPLACPSGQEVEGVL
jgi:hypothetical protein